MSPLADVANAYEHRRANFLNEVGQAQAIQREFERVTAEVTQASIDAFTAGQVVALFQSYSESEQQGLQARVEGMVTMGLQSIFGEDLSFRMTPGNERGQATLRFTVESPAAGATDVLEARGGGLAAVVGFILRVVVVALHPDRIRRFFVLDETFGMVSDEYQEELGRFLRRLVDEAGLQILLVTHAPKVGLQADKVYRVTHDGTRTVVKAIGPEEL